MISETDYIEEHRQDIHGAVISFMRRCKGRQRATIPYEDLYQTVCVALIEYIRRGGDAHIFPFFDALHAMTREVMTLQPLTGQRNTKKIKDLLTAQPRLVPLIEVNELLPTWEADTITLLDFEQFLSEQDKGTRAIIHWRMEGQTIQQIAQAEQITKQAMYKRMTGIRERYGKYI